MTRRHKSIPVEKLSEALLRKFPVWEFATDEEGLSGQDETWVRPVKKLPITTGDERLVGCEFTLADGSTLFGFLGNLSLKEAERNAHFLTLSIFVRGKVKHLARYHDADVEERGPKWLAATLGKKEQEVFPLFYDVSTFVRGKKECLRGSIPRQPEKMLSDSEIIQLAINR